MKKNIFRILLAVIAFAFMFALVGCEDTPKTDSEKAEQISAWVKDQVGVNITEDIDLPTTHPTLGGTITWFSDDTDVLDNDGSIVDRGKRASDVELGYVVNCAGAVAGDYITVHVSPITLEEAMDKVESLLPRKEVNGEKEYFVSRNIDLPNNYYNVITCGYESSNEEIFTNEGKYTKPAEATTVTLKVTASDSYNTITREFVMSVQGKTSLEVLDEGIQWLDDNMLDLMLTEESGLPTKSATGANITWTSSDVNVVSEDGKVKEFLYERYVSLRAKVEYDGNFKTRDYFCKVKAMDSSNMTMEEKIANYADSVAVDKLARVSFNAYANLNHSYAHIYLFDGTGPDITVQIIKDGLGNKPDRNRISTQFVTVHDTGNPSNGANAEMHARYIGNGSGGATTSWHYAVDDVSIYQHINMDEITWHAADGSRTYNLLDTGVKATMGYPALSISSDRYFVLGGQKTKIKIPSDCPNANVKFGRIYFNVGANGNYWMNNAYYNTGYGVISNCGGNQNSVSMESCVHNGSDYMKTFVNACKLTVMLLRHYKLDCDRINQHYDYCGKNCPQAIREANQWAQFKDLCSKMLYGLDTFGDYQFTWTPNDTTKLSKTGFVSLSCKAGTTVSYSLKVTKSGVSVYEKSYVTNLI